jgi:hypothetical protein
LSTGFKPLTLPPGVVAQATKKMQSSNYSEVNMVRWVEGQLAPIGGQSKYNFTFASKCKAILGWYDLAQVYHIAYLCESNLYVATGGALLDITPVDGIKPPQPPTQGGYGDGLYGQGLQLSATAAWTTATPNITMVANPGGVAPGMNVWNVTQGLNVGVVSTYNGTALVLTANAANAGAANDVLNFGAYGESRAISAAAAIDRLPDAYSLQNFGAVLLAMTSADGRLLQWNPASAPGTKAAVITPASGSTVPHGRFFVVTPERFVQVFGSYLDGTPSDGGSFRRFAWCEQEDYTNWNYSDVTTQAGFIDVEPSSPIVCGIATRSGTLFFTGKKAYRSRYLGTPYVYNYDELGDNCTPWSPQSLATTSSMVLWFSQQGPYSYDGTSILPVQCMVRAWIDDDIDLLQVRQQSCAIHVANFNEFWWCYPQDGLTGNTRIAIYNYKEGWWSQARCARSAGVTASYTSHTIMANDRVAYEHENGFTYWDAELPWIETFDLNIDGGKLVTVKQMLPDIEGAITNVMYSLFYRNSRSLGLVEQQTVPRTVRQDGYVDLRTTGRDIRLRIALAIPAGIIIDGVASDGSVRPVTVGNHLIDAVPRGDR